MKTEPDALGTAENESGHAKLENETRRPRYRYENESGNAKKRDSTPSVPPKTCSGARALCVLHSIINFKSEMIDLNHLI
jgi:hypothetical protein